MSETTDPHRPARRRACLRAMGIPIYRLRHAESMEDVGAMEREGKGSACGPPSSGERMDPARMGWADLETAVAACRACGLCDTRNRVVFGVGDREAELMIVGEAPGAEEDRKGEPFVGRAGMLLDNMLLAMGLRRDEVYIANILKCRPPGNRNPTVEEAAACAPFLKRQMALVNPRVILAVGGVAAHNLLATDESVGRLRGRFHTLPDGRGQVLVTYHPAYLLRRPEEKAKAWADLQLLMERLHG